MSQTIASGTPTQSGAASRLKDHTQQHHRDAEGKAWQQAMLAGRLTREDYARWLAGMFAIHTAVESAVRSAAAAGVHPRLAELAAGREHAGKLRADLAAIAPMVSPHSSPAGEAAAREIAALAACSPLAPLGMLYVLEGSTNGNRFIVRAVRGGLRLTPGTGDSYLNCYGEEQPVRWQSFKQGLESATFTEAEYQQLADGAVLIFQAVGHLSDELANPSGQKVMTTPIYTDGRKGAWHG